MKVFLLLLLLVNLGYGVWQLFFGVPQMESRPVVAEVGGPRLELLSERR